MAFAARSPVGVIIPTFNRREYLHLALESVLNQSWSGLDVVVVDNGSTDGTAEAMARVGDGRVRYVVNPRNLGMAGSVDVGIRLLGSDVGWCTVLADDDLLDPGFVSAALARAAEHPRATGVDGHRVFVDAGGARLREALPAPATQGAIELLEARARRLRELYLTGLLFRRERFTALGGYPAFSSGLASDDALVFGLALAGEVVHAPAAIAAVRLHGEAESRTARDGLEKLRTVDEFCAWCRARIEVSGATPAERARFEAALASYARQLRSHWWQVTARAAADSRDGFTPADLPVLRELVQARPNDYGVLVRWSVLLERQVGIDLERAPWYRAAARWLERARTR